MLLAITCNIQFGIVVVSLRKAHLFQSSFNMACDLVCTCWSSNGIS